MATVLDTMADAMAVIDRDGKIQFLNGPAEELSGWKNDDARDAEIARVLPLAHLVSGLDASYVLSLPPGPRRANQLPRGLMASVRSGRRFPIEGEFAPSIDSGRVVGAVITFRDATSRQLHENEIRQQNKMQAVGRLAAGVAHDFNSLHFIILGYADEMLSSSGLSSSDLLALNEIQKAADSAASITRQLLQFSHKEAVEKQDVNLNDADLRCGELIPPPRWSFHNVAILSSARASEIIAGGP